MKLQLKPLHEQIMVITGASSGIGLVTATMAAERGARVVLAARNAQDLEAAVSGIRAGGGRAVSQVADVADPAQVELVAATALREFGRIDTWVNNAAVAMYGRLTEMSVDDMRRQFDINYWGQVHGSRAAVTHLSADGGAIINVASALADRAIPLQGNYCAAKHALKAFTDTLRMELEEAGIPISVTLIKPASVDTPFFEKARTALGTEPQPVPPVYAPEVVARAILAAATHPRRDIIAGGMGKVLSLAARTPRLADHYMERKTFKAQMTDEPTSGRPDNLFSPLPHDGGERGRNWSGHVRGTSLYTAVSLHPVRSMIAAGCMGVAAVALLRGRH